jgi:TatD DNase family protein
MFADTHCHLDDRRFEKDLPQVISRAEDAGLVLMINSGADMASSEASVRLARQNEGFIFANIGFHPNRINELNAQSLKRLRTLAKDSVVLAIGEIGLDYHWNTFPAWQQKEAFRAQLDLARELRLPVVIHSRKSTDDVLEILLEWHTNLPTEHPQKARPGALHSWSDSYAKAKPLIEAGFYFGVSGPVTYLNAPDRRECTAALPLERILIETDCPYLTPHPLRGKRNEPAYVLKIVEEVARLHHKSVQETAEITTRNAFKLYGLKIQVS